MGRGCAKAAADIDPRLPLQLGNAIKECGNNVQIIGTLLGAYEVVSFPVKPTISVCAEGKTNVVSHMRDRMTVGKVVPGWACLADMTIIKRSAQQLVSLTEKAGWMHVVLPRPGIGAGCLNWDDVKPVLEKILDDRFYVITFGRK